MITNLIHLASKYRDFILNRTYETHESAASTVITVSKTRNVQKLEKKKKAKRKSLTQRYIRYEFKQCHPFNQKNKIKNEKKKCYISKREAKPI